MPTKPHFFASHHFERMAHRRDQDAWLERRRNSGKSWFLPVAASKNLVFEGPPPAAALLTLEQVDMLSCPHLAPQSPALWPLRRGHGQHPGRTCPGLQRPGLRLAAVSAGRPGHHRPGQRWRALPAWTPGFVGRGPIFDHCRIRRAGRIAGGRRGQGGIRGIRHRGALAGLSLIATLAVSKFADAGFPGKRRKQRDSFARRRTRGRRLVYARRPGQRYPNQTCAQRFNISPAGGRLVLPADRHKAGSNRRAAKGLVTHGRWPAMTEPRRFYPPLAGFLAGRQRHRSCAW